MGLYTIFCEKKLKTLVGKASMQRYWLSSWPKQHLGDLNGLKIVHKFYFLVAVNFLFSQPGYTSWYFVLLVATWHSLGDKNNVQSWDPAAEWSESVYESTSVEFCNSTPLHRGDYSTLWLFFWSHDEGLKKFSKRFAPAPDGADLDQTM